MRLIAGGHSLSVNSPTRFVQTSVEKTSRRANAEGMRIGCAEGPRQIEHASGYLAAGAANDPSNAWLNDGLRVGASAYEAHERILRVRVARAVRFQGGAVLKNR